MITVAALAAGALAADVPAVQLAGGRRFAYAGTFSSERDVNPKRSFWKKLVDVVAGPPQFRCIVRPYGIATDFRGAVLVTDPGAQLVHVFDFEQKKYRHLDGGGKRRFRSPIGVATDGENIYVTDSYLGRIFVFDRNYKFRRFLGEAGGEGFFKRPTGIAIDRNARRIYLSDTLRDKIYVLDLDGNVLHSFGQRGTAPGEFNFPADLALRGDELIVNDSMNFRVQIFDPQGGFRGTFGKAGTSTGTLYRAKGVAVDSEGDIYVADAAFETVQLFDREGRLLYYFGGTGTGPGQFQLPAGLSIDQQDRVYVADSLNRRVQVFQFTAAPASGKGGAQ
ncbi:MAG: 6-bladed beta-propeller [Terriglobales bacterium]